MNKSTKASFGPGQYKTYKKGVDIGNGKYKCQNKGNGTRDVYGFTCINNMTLRPFLCAVLNFELNFFLINYLSLHGNLNTLDILTPAFHIKRCL